LTVVGIAAGFCYIVYEFNSLKQSIDTSEKKIEALQKKIKTDTPLKNRP
jgi:hypothetical protein